MKTEQKNISLWMMIFNEVAEQGSFTAAAEKLNLTKSGVSQHVSHLEQHLGVQLLIRSTRSLSLTGAGEKVLQRSHELKALLDITIDEVNNIKQQPSGLLSITAPQALIQPAVLPAIKQLVIQFPNIKPRLILDDAIQDIVKQGIDVAIRVGELQDSELKAGKLGNVQEILVASSAYFSVNKPISLDNLNQHPFIITSWQKNRLNFPFVNEKKQIQDILLQPMFEVNSANVALDMALLDLGIALLPSIYVHEYIKKGRMQQILSDLHGQTENVYYVHAYHSNTPLKVKWFIKFLSRYF